MCSSRPPRRHIRCGGAALDRRSSAVAARALLAVRTVVIGGARSLQAAVSESSRPLGQSPSRYSRGAAARGAARALLAFTVPLHPMRRCGAQPPPLCSGGSRSLRGARHRQWRRALSAGGRRRVVASFKAVAVALLSRRRCMQRRSCAPRVCRAAASDAAVWRSASAPLQRRLALSARCASPSVAARALCGRPSASCRVLQSGRRRATLATPLHAAPLVRSSRLPCRRIRCGGVALGRRSSVTAARALCAVRVVVRGGARSLRAAVGESSRPSGRSPSRCPRGAVARDAGHVLLAPTAPPHPMRRCGA